MRGRTEQRRAYRREMARLGQEGQFAVEAVTSNVRICLSCGYVHAQVQPETFGYRQDASPVRAAVEKCSHCGESTLTDPASEVARHGLQQSDEEDHEERSTRTSRLVAGSCVVAILLAVLGELVYVVFSFVHDLKGSALGLIPGLVLILAFGTPIGYLLLRLWTEYRESRRFRRPARWRFVEPKGRRKSRLQGAVVCSTPLYAPLSGRPCAGYEIGVRDDTNADAPLGTWFLLEQRVAPCTVAGQELSPERTALRLTRTMHTSSAPPHQTHYLRDRGFDANAMGRTLFESIVPLDASVAVIERRDGSTTLDARDC